MRTLNIEIIAIGNEVLSGATSNTNAAEISQALLQIGVVPSRHSVLPDDPHVLRSELRLALDRSNLVITTGGLGPTLDDLTRNIAAELYHSHLAVDPFLVEDLTKRYGSQLTTIQDQATVPVKAKVFPNPVGTAPGFLFEEHGKRLILLPGVPLEMRKMLADHVIPFVNEMAARTERHFRKTVNLLELPEAAVDPFLREIAGRYPTVAFGIYPSLGILGIHMTVQSSSQKEADRLIDPPLREFLQKFKANTFQAPSGKIDEAVHALLLASGATLSLAESCTGGAIAARLVRHPGASEYLLGGVVAYSNAMKESVLHVPKELIQSHGAVSGEVVEAMLNGILELTGSDYAAAVSGVAGPSGGTPAKPVGTVWCGIAKKDENMQTWQLQARGSREMIIERSINAVLSRLYKLVKQESGGP